MKILPLCVLLFLVAAWDVRAQVDIDPEMAGTGHFDMTGFPQWTIDLRRGSIIAFGAFPFAYLASVFIFDWFRVATNDWDRRFAPWPFYPPGRIGHSEADQFRIIGIGAATSVVIAVIDHGIMRSRRNRAAREARALAPGTPIIIRTPLHEEEAAFAEPESP